MKKSKIATSLFVPIKDEKYLINGKGDVRVYKSEESLKKNTKSCDKILVYKLEGEKI